MTWSSVAPFIGTSRPGLPILSNCIRRRKKILLLLLWLSAACYFDYRRDKIPNALIGFGMLAGLLYRAYLFYMGCVPGGKETLFESEAAVGLLLLQSVMAVGLLLLRTGIIFMVFYPLYKLGTLGAGDVKLFCLLAFFLQGRECTVCIIGSLVISAFAGVGKLLGQGNLKERLLYFCSYAVDVVRYKEFGLYFENVGHQEKRKASLHMAGTVLLSVLLYAGGVYGVFL